jgi:hypothetical protein
MDKQLRGGPILSSIRINLSERLSDPLREGRLTFVSICIGIFS